jgi:hypothetical protein
MRYFREGASFRWDSPWIREQVYGEVAELEGILVSTSHGIIGRELEGFGNSAGLDLRFWTDTPSGNYEELAKIKKEPV